MRENFCSAPWSSLSFDPDGQVKLCCISRQRVVLDQFGQARTNTDFVAIRQDFIKDQQSPNCDTCWDRERKESQWESRRSIYQYDYFHDLADAEQFRLEHLDLRWSNTCNLNCVYCHPTYSSKWAELQGIKTPYRIFPTVTDQDLANLRVLQLAGGEPFLIKENLEILDRISRLNPDVEVEITTNLTQIANNPIYRTLRKLDHVRFVVSFESTGPRFEYIRNGANWQTFQRNLAVLKTDFDHIQFNMVYFPLSSIDIVNAMIIALEHTAPENIFVVDQIGGHGFDMLSQHAVQYIKQSNLDQSIGLPEVLQQRFLNHVNKITTQKDTTTLPQYDRFDRLTNQDHRSIFTELYQ